MEKVDFFADVVIVPHFANLLLLGAKVENFILIFMMPRILLSLSEES